MPQTLIAGSRSHSASGDPLQKPRHLLTTLVLQVVASQRMRRERGQLAELSDATLKDLGLTRADVWNELRKPAWRR